VKLARFPRSFEINAAFDIYMSKCDRMTSGRLLDNTTVAEFRTGNFFATFRITLPHWSYIMSQVNPILTRAIPLS
jgi:hypothetical protein